ncbi:hypothetical protein SL054_001978 [Flavobacterium psychrophilum]|nr:hypothetical protein [Flavobacterium psychrophilum]ELY1992628.1 hypothetical protein [Flavobacterium psychrophilum]
MSDLEKMKLTFSELKVGYEIITAMEENKTETHITEYVEKVKWDSKLRIDHGMGYSSLYGEFYFLEGKYQNQGLWE